MIHSAQRVLLLTRHSEQTETIQLLLREFNGECSSPNEFRLLLDAVHEIPENIRSLIPSGTVSYDAALISLDAPYQNGMELWQWFLINKPSIPVVILASPSQREKAKSCVRSGAADWLDASALSGKLLVNTLHLAIQNASKQSDMQTLLTGMFNAMRDEVLAVDRGYQILLSNKPDSPCTNPGAMCFPSCYKELGKEFPCQWCKVQDVFETGNEYSVIVPDGNSSHNREENHPLTTQKALEITFTPLMNSAGRVSLVIEQRRDVTHQITAEEALRKSETRYRTLTENIPKGAVLMFDKNMQNTVAAGGALMDMAISPELLSGKRLHSVLPESIADLFEEQFTRALQGDESSFVIFSDDNTRCFEVHVMPVASENGNIDACMTMLFEITEHRDARREVESSQRRFKAVFENSRDGIGVYERIKGVTQRRLIDCNTAYTQLAGHTREELLELEDIGCIQRMDAEKMDRLHRKIMREEACTGSFMWLRPDGKRNHMEFTATPVRQGDRVLVYEIIRDMTDRARAEAALMAHSATLEKTVADRTVRLTETLKYAEEARERIDVILKSVGDGLIVADNDGRVVMMNRSAEKLLNIRQTEVIGESFLHLVSRLGCPKSLSQSLRLRRYNDSGHNFTVTDHTGESRYLRIRLSPVLDRKGNTIGVVASMYGVTREREVDMMKDEFISTAAHELRIPLTTIMGFSEIITIRDELSRNDVNAYAKLINQSANTLSGIVADLLDISRIESGKGFSIVPVRRNLAILIAEYLSVAKKRHPHHNFMFTPPDYEPLASIDADKMAQVLDNIVSNAVKYSSQQSTITISLRMANPVAVTDEAPHQPAHKANSPEACHVISIQDEGVGMNPEQVRRIFERFYRGHASNGGIQGTGLGMSITRHIIELHGGTIWVESTPGRGTIISLSIPAYADIHAVAEC